MLEVELLHVMHQEADQGEGWTHSMGCWCRAKAGQAIDLPDHAGFYYWPLSKLEGT